MGTKGIPSFFYDWPPAYRRLDVWLFFLSLVVFILLPQLDLWFSGLFYRPDEGFYLKDNPIVRAVYLVFAKTHFVFLIVLLALCFRRKIIGLNAFTAKWDPQRANKSIAFLLILLLLGPGLLVNVVLKDNSNGRPRPSQVVEFGGERQFTSFWQYSGECKHNCSFVSGHASAGFYLMGFAWVFRRRKLLYLGMVAGVMVGFGRVLQGGHFLSDVLFCFWLMYGLCQILASSLRLNWTPEPSHSDRSASVNSKCVS